ncbi:hypothetical protein QUV61_22405, partial [Xanthomonas citri pv. citri]
MTRRQYAEGTTQPTMLPSQKRVLARSGSTRQARRIVAAIFISSVATQPYRMSFQTTASATGQP